MLPGMTGLWQITPNRHGEDAEANIITLDLAYVDSWSLIGDLAILAQTVLVVFKGRLTAEFGAGWRDEDLVAAIEGVGRA